MLHWVEWEAVAGLVLRVTVSEYGIRRIDLAPKERAVGAPDSAHPLLCEAMRQLGAYFAGDIREFRLPLDPQGTEFQKRVWQALESIPYGQTRSYREIARAIGSERAVRAVGAANGSNPIPIVIPCHRVIGTNGKLVGYGGGLALKQRLLELEMGYSERFA